MTHLQSTTAEGIPVKGNFVWSAMDDLEWGIGYGVRFGMVYVDFKTQKSIQKLSAIGGRLRFYVRREIRQYNEL